MPDFNRDFVAFYRLLTENVSRTAGWSQESLTVIELEQWFSVSPRQTIRYLLLAIFFGTTNFSVRAEETKYRKMVPPACGKRSRSLPHIVAPRNSITETYLKQNSPVLWTCPSRAPSAAGRRADRTRTGPRATGSARAARTGPPPGECRTCALAGTWSRWPAWPPSGSGRCRWSCWSGRWTVWPPVGKEEKSKKKCWIRLFFGVNMFDSKY